MTRVKAPSLRRRAALLTLLNAAAAAYSAAGADYGRGASTSVVANMFLILGWVAAVFVISYLEAEAVRTLVLRGGWRGHAAALDDPPPGPRPWRDLHLPLTIAIACLLGVNMLAFDALSGGFFVKGHAAAAAVTQLRSDDRAVQRDGVLAAASSSDPRVERALVEVLDRPGPHRSLAAWAAGMSRAASAEAALARALRDGDAPTRAAAAVALARLRSPRLIDEVLARLGDHDEPLEAYLFGLGVLGDARAAAPVATLLHDADTAPDHLAVAAWTLGQLRERRACIVLAQQITGAANPLTCAAAHSTQALRCPGDTTALRLAFEDSSPSDRCEGQQFVDHDGRPYDLWPRGLYRVRLLEAILAAGDPDAVPWLSRVARDGSVAPQLRAMAAAMRHASPPRAP